MRKFKEDLKNVLLEIFIELKENNPGKLIEYVESQGKEVKLQENKLTIKSRGFACVLELGSADVDQAQQIETLLYALIGPMWPVLFNDVYKEVVSDIKKEALK